MRTFIRLLMNVHIAILLAFGAIHTAYSDNSIPCDNPKDVTTSQDIPSSLNIKVAECISYYTITGSTVAELIASMDANKPAQNQGWRAYTTHNWKWNYESTGMTDTGCAAQNVSGRVDVNISLPKLSSEANISQSVKDTWNSYLTNLTAHEQGHGKISIDVAKAVVQALVDARLPDCNNIKSHLSTVAKQAEQSVTQSDSKYDQETRSGATQGATLNLALGANASQSSTAYGADARRAVDGNTDGNYFSSGKSVTHTADAEGSWWEVDLGTMRQIENIVLWNRTDCCAERLSNFSIIIKNGTNVVWRHNVSGQAPTQLAIPVQGVNGQTVRIELADKNPLSLAEVQAMGY